MTTKILPEVFGKLLSAEDDGMDVIDRHYKLKQWQIDQEYAHATQTLEGMDVQPLTIQVKNSLKMAVGKVIDDDGLDIAAKLGEIKKLLNNHVKHMNILADIAPASEAMESDAAAFGRRLTSRT